MSWDDDYRRYHWSAPPPQRGLGELGRMALDLKGLSFVCGFVFLLLVLMAGGKWPALYFGFLVAGPCSFLALFTDTYPIAFRWVIIVQLWISTSLAVVGIAWFGEFTSTIVMAIYALVVGLFVGYQIKKVGRLT